MARFTPQSEYATSPPIAEGGEVIAFLRGQPGTDLAFAALCGC